MRPMTSTGPPMEVHDERTDENGFHHKERSKILCYKQQEK
jgi:hypothetical protein